MIQFDDSGNGLDGHTDVGDILYSSVYDLVRENGIERHTVVVEIVHDIYGYHVMRGNGLEGHTDVGVTLYSLVYDVVRESVIAGHTVVIDIVFVII